MSRGIDCSASSGFDQFRSRKTKVFRRENCSARELNGLRRLVDENLNLILEAWREHCDES